MQLEILTKKIKNLPKSSGVYQFFDKNSKLLYIGKAKILSNRVKSYFSFTPFLSPASNLSLRIEKMISEVSDMDYIMVNNEHDALILENSLIKQLKPKYNILLRDDKTYPYIYVDFENDFPRFEITRKIVSKKQVKYFGPFSSGATSILKALYANFKLVQRKSCVREKKACLFAQIDKCHAPCEGKISKEDYRAIVKQATNCLNDRKLITKELNIKMQEYAQNMQFEEALEMKKTIESLEKSVIKTPIDFANLQNVDVFTVSISENKACVLKTFFREGKLVSTAYHFVKNNLQMEPSDLYRRVIVDYYNANPIIMPNEILVCDELEAEDLQDVELLLSAKAHKKIPIHTPKIGLKKQLTQTTMLNAKMLLDKELKQNLDEVLLQMQQQFSLERTPYRIEIFDNSHISTQAKVGAMVVYENSEWDKNSYRQYHLEAMDEYAQMKELLTRRVDKRDKEPLPDLWIIDGGKTLLSLAKLIVNSLGLDLDIIAIAKEKIDAKAHRAKGRANDIVYTQDDIFKLPTDNKALLLAQKLRDEAHRFAIKNHRALKMKEDKQVSLLKVKGVGEAKIVKLLSYFGNFENIQKASVEELENVVPNGVALAVVGFFKGGA